MAESSRYNKKRMQLNTCVFYESLHNIESVNLWILDAHGYELKGESVEAACTNPMKRA